MIELGARCRSTTSHPKIKARRSTRSRSRIQFAILIAARIWVRVGSGSGDARRRQAYSVPVLERERLAVLLPGCPRVLVRGEYPTRRRGLAVGHQERRPTRVLLEMLSRFQKSHIPMGLVGFALVPQTGGRWLESSDVVTTRSPPELQLQDSRAAVKFCHTVVMSEGNGRDPQQLRDATA
jgi:hypothetical protein